MPSKTCNKSGVAYLCKSTNPLVMKYFLAISLIFCIAICSAQTKLELTPQGFPLLEIPTPQKPLDQLIIAAKAWASYYNKKGYDVFDVTENSLTIEALNENAYQTWNLGVKYNHDIRYTLRIAFKADQKYTLTFIVKEIYADKILMKTTVADFFLLDGKLKDDFRDAKPSLENTANRIINSFINFIAQ